MESGVAAVCPSLAASTASSSADATDIGCHRHQTQEHRCDAGCLQGGILPYLCCPPPRPPQRLASSDRPPSRHTQQSADRYALPLLDPCFLAARPGWRRAGAAKPEAQEGSERRPPTPTQDWAVAEWKNFKKVYSKSYTSPEQEKAKYKVYLQSRKEVAEINARANGTWTAALNEFSDETWEEFQANRLMAPQNCSATHKGSGWKAAANKQIPPAIDWRSKIPGWTVKSQGHCGSCCAPHRLHCAPPTDCSRSHRPTPDTGTFSTAGSMEAHHYLKYGVLKNLSEQQLVDCGARPLYARPGLYLPPRHPPVRVAIPLNACNPPHHLYLHPAPRQPTPSTTTAATAACPPRPSSTSSTIKELEPACAHHFLACAHSGTTRWIAPLRTSLPAYMITL